MGWINNEKEVIVINNYNQINKKVLAITFAMALVCVLFLVISITELIQDKDFYTNSGHINALVTNVNDKENTREIRVSYKVNNSLYTKDFSLEKGELSYVNIGDTLDIFYNKTNPKDARTSSKSLVSMVIIISLLLVAAITLIVSGIVYYIRVRTNIRLININKTIEAKFYRLEFKNSLMSNERINYVYCKAIVNGEKRIFKSVGFKNKPKPLNDNSIINVYIDDKNNYLVNVYEIFE